MRVGIDCRSLRAGPSGVATYVRHLTARLPELECYQASRPANNFAWNCLRPPLAQLARGWDVFHAPAYTGPLLNPVPLVLSVHDVSYLVHPDWYPYRLDFLRRRYYEASLCRADRLVVCSDFSLQELLRLFPDFRAKTRRVYLGVSPDFRPDPEGARRIRRERDLPERYALHVGDIHARRNVPLIAAAAERCGLALVLVGRILKGGEAFSHWPYRFSHLNEPDLRALYSGAEVFVYASVYEGFGLPLLEAMACGLPVVAAARSCLPEICGEAACLVEPETAALADGIRRVLDERDDYSQRGLRRAAEFGWDRTAAETKEIYRQLL